MNTIDIFETGRPTYSIEYTSEELEAMLLSISGDLEGTRYEFGYDTVRISRTTNPIRRWWGDICGAIAGWSLRQNEKHGDYYMILDEEYTNMKIVELEQIESPIYDKN